MISGLKFVNAGAAVGLALLVYQTHKQIWQLDMEHKKAVWRSRADVLGRMASKSDKFLKKCNQITFMHLIL